MAIVEPQCPHCATFFKNLASLANHYLFRLITVPIAEDSQSEVLALYCLTTTDRAAALTALLEHRADVPTAKGTCGLQTAQHTLITAQRFGLRGPPS